MLGIVEWRPVVGFEGKYDVSSDGQVWSRPRRRLLTPVRTDQGYLIVCLSRPPGSVNRKIHRLVLEAFAGPAPDGTETRHLVGDPAHNDLPVLAWGTKLENAADVRRHGRDLPTTQERCRRSGHLLVAPNLVPYNLRHGYRACRSCYWGANIASKRRAKGVVIDRDRLASEMYAHLMEGAPDPRLALAGAR